MELDEIIKILKGFTSEDWEKLKEISQSNTYEDVANPLSEEEPSNDDTLSAGSGTNCGEPTEGTDDKQNVEEPTEPADPGDSEGIQSQESKTEVTIPSMTKPTESTLEEPQQEPIQQQEPTNPTDIQGENIPIDYEQIVEGLNAKILALQTENAKLKAKTDGAFGLTSKYGGGVKVNRLYDDNTTDIHFKKHN